MDRPQVAQRQREPIPVLPGAPAARWGVLAAYALLAACTQLLWLTFAPVDTEAARAMHSDVGSVGDLAAVFPFVYVVLALPAGRWLDARFGRALGAGALLTGAGALVRIVSPTTFGWQLAGQLVIAAGQPLVLNSITKVAARHFPERERALAISIGSVALFAGILAAVLSGGPLLAAGGLQPILASFGEGGAAGNLVAAMTLAGVVGAAGLPPAIAARDRRRTLLAAAMVVSVAAFTAVALRQEVPWLAAWLSLEGLLLLACLPVVLDWSAIRAGPALQGAAAGFLMMAGNLGGLLLVLVAQALIGNPRLPLFALAAVAVAGLGLVALLPARAAPATAPDG